MSKRLDAVTDVLEGLPSVSPNTAGILAERVIEASDAVLFSEGYREHAVLSLHMLGGMTVSECRDAVTVVCASLSGDRDLQLATMSLMLPVDDVTAEMIEAYEKVTKR